MQNILGFDQPQGLWSVVQSQNQIGRAGIWNTFEW